MTRFSLKAFIVDVGGSLIAATVLAALAWLGMFAVGSFADLAVSYPGWFGRWLTAVIWMVVFLGSIESDDWKVQA